MLDVCPRKWERWAAPRQRTEAPWARHDRSTSLSPRQGSLCPHVLRYRFGKIATCVHLDAGEGFGEILAISVAGEGVEMGGNGLAQFMDMCAHLA